MGSHIPQCCFILSLLCVMNSLPIPLQNIFSQNILIFSTYSDLLKLILVHTPGLGSCKCGQHFSSSLSRRSPFLIKKPPWEDMPEFWSSTGCDLLLGCFPRFIIYHIILIFWNNNAKAAFQQNHCLLSGVGKGALSFSGKMENIPLVSVFVSLTDS